MKFECKLLGLIALGLLAMAAAPPVRAGGRAKVVQETSEYLLQRFGRTAFREGVETLATKIEAYAARYGDEFLKAIRQVGPRTFALVEQAGAHGNQAVRVMAKYGEHGATWVVARPKGMQLVVKYGDDAAATLCRHKAVAEPILEQLGKPALKALQTANVQNGRRLAMMLEGGELAKIGRSPELLEVIAKHGNAACDFIWKHKGSLATAAVLTSFLASPESFIQGTTDIAAIVGENVVKPIMQIPGTVATEAARGTNWTAVILILGGIVVLCFAVKYFKFGRWLQDVLQAQRERHGEERATNPSALSRPESAIKR